MQRAQLNHYHVLAYKTKQDLLGRMKHKDYN